MFGKPIFVMLVNLEQRRLAQVNVEKVKQSMQEQGFFCSYRRHQKICWNNIRSAKRAKLPDEDGSGGHLEKIIIDSTGPSVIGTRTRQ